MASPKRTRLERERDLQRIADGYLKGQQTQAEIGEVLGISQSQVSRDLKTLRNRWLDASLRTFDEARAEQLAKLDRVEYEHWRGWEASVAGNRPGSPAYLHGVLRCIARRCTLLGLDAPGKVAPTDPSGKEQYVGGGLSGLLAEIEAENAVP
jgi:hypothetical protein